ncbi:LapA family protein [Mycobacterium sp. Y57]|uniref:protein UsfY n=1 Tax=Mycolicibacterium xanthum TaxID=2796469 RepID=UPI001C8435AF|nr:protein UsfY [Mycolicibacterium xanthum]MBX7432625.1 LapA family protein [Mycolicibacterium xanthum]
MKGAHHDPVDHARTTQPHAGESFIDTLWLPGLILIGIGTVLIAATVAATAYGSRDASLILGLVAGALVTAGALLVTLEHQRVKRVERQWLADHPERTPHLRAG